MPYYADLSRKGHLGAEWAADPVARDRAVDRLQALRALLSDSANPDSPPARRLNTLLLATWNLREFDSSTWGQRLPETYMYLAEIVDRFDLIAIQEVREDLYALDRLKSRLGANWSYLVSDVTEGRAGNRERLAYLYDTTKVRFLGMAGELVLPPVSGPNHTVLPAAQVARTPLMAAFQVGWTKLVVATVHIVYGEDTAEPAARVDEIRQVATFLKARSDSRSEAVRNFIALGDFNIFTAGDATLKALTDDGGFTVPDALQASPGSNIARNKKYDQIAFRNRMGRFEHTGRAGVVNYYSTVFREEDEPAYRPYIKAYIDARHARGSVSPQTPADDAGWRRDYATWKTYQMSDHLPMWCEFRVDFASEYLADLAAQPD